MRQTTWGMVFVGIAALAVSCRSLSGFRESAMAAGREGGERTFSEDVRFLKEHADVIVLSDPDGGGRVAVTPRYQGRVMTSTPGGDDGYSVGWLNDKHIEAGKMVPHINVFGGEDRFWLGPEGGQFAIFFPEGTTHFTLETWQTPAVVDSVAYDVESKTDTEVVFTKSATVKNVSGTVFDVGIRRTIRLLSGKRASADLGMEIPAGVAMVAYESENRLSNRGKIPWTKETGLLSIWILGMFKPTPDTTVVVPFKAGTDAELGRKVNDAYFGKVPEDRLIVRDDVLFFRADGLYRCKIGVSPFRARPVLGSYNESRKLLTIVQYTLPEGAVDYVNSMWEIQKRPYGGDVVNAYNDGPPAPGKKPLGPFYEIETSSPAAALAPGASLTHIHRTFHFTGREADLDKIARRVLGVSIEEIKEAF